ncbi:MAG TPA: hypothetical protein VM328_10685 [Fimbriimonadaceae bacterium]|nr:hypothetical protein [Fimbriimonadaceae bacterium]
MTHPYNSARAILPASQKSKLLAICSLALFLPLNACQGGGDGDVTGNLIGFLPTPPTNNTPTTPSSGLNARDWEIGPIIDGKNYSKNVPATPTQNGEGWYIDLPTSDGVHYVTHRYGSLSGKSKMTIRYRIEMADGVKIVPSTDPSGPAIGPTLYFQRKGDDWRTDGWRWWATFSSPVPIVAGEFEVTAPLDGPWTSVNTKTATANPVDFANAKANAERVGFTLGGGTGFGHGVYATGPARLVVTSFTIE